MITPEEARTRVAKGAAHLDRLWPPWAEHINTGTLRISSRCDCILGQLTGDYRTGAFALYPEPSFYGRCCAMVKWQRALTTQDQVIAHGFDIAPSPLLAERRSDFNRLQDAWIEAIADRLHALPQTTNAVDPVAQIVAEGLRA